MTEEKPHPDMTDNDVLEMILHYASVSFMVCLLSKKCGDCSTWRTRPHASRQWESPQGLIMPFDLLLSKGN